MKHEILEEVWRVRDQISAECGHDVKKLGAMLRREESKYADRLPRLPIQRRSVPGRQQARAVNRVQPPAHGRLRLHDLRDSALRSAHGTRA